MLGRRAETIVGRQGAEAATSTRRSSAIVDNAPRALIGSSCLPLLPDDAAYLFGRNRIAEARGHTNFLVRSCSPIGGDGHRIDKRHRPIPAISNIIGRRRKRYNRFRPPPYHPTSLPSPSPLLLRACPAQRGNPVAAISARCEVLRIPPAGAGRRGEAGRNSFGRVVRCSPSPGGWVDWI